jgi:hypothetical protein
MLRVDFSRASCEVRERSGTVPNMTDDGLTLAEAQRVLGIGKTKMYELINGGEIETFDVSEGDPKPSRRVGEKGPRPSRRVRASEIERYIERNRVPAP